MGQRMRHDCVFFRHGLGTSVLSKTLRKDLSFLDAVLARDLDGGMSLSFPGPPLGLGTGPNHHEEVDIHRKGNKLRCYPQQLESFCFVSIFHSAVICTGTLQNRNRYLQRNPPEPNKVSASEPSGTSPGIPTNIMN